MWVAVAEWPTAMTDLYIINHFSSSWCQGQFGSIFCTVVVIYSLMLRT